MPRLGADMEAGTVLEWHVKPGDAVRRGDLVALVDTDKAAIEIECFEDGVVEEILVEPGTKVPVGTPLARLASAAGRVQASPAARRAAAESGVDLAGVRGSGPDGAIVLADVERAASEKAPSRPSAPAPTATPDARRSAERSAAMRRAIAAAMSRSKREIPHYYLGATLDFSKAQRFLEAENARRPVTERLLPAALLVKSVALALREVPELNGFFRNGAFSPGEGIHVGVAISIREGGLVAPALRDADGRSLDDVMRTLADLVRRARSGGLRSSEMTDATITVTNLGDQGVETVFGVIHPPQVALVGFGRIRERAWAESGVVSARPVVTASLAADHRASDGHGGARLLTAIDRMLQDPEAL